MNELWHVAPELLTYYVVAFAVGIACAVFFFGGLWLTLHVMMEVRHPVLLVFLSFAVRIGIIVLLIFWVSDGQLDRMAVCVGAFIVTRALLVRRLPAPVQAATGEMKKGGDGI